jgi:hypothetical protein
MSRARLKPSGLRHRGGAVRPSTARHIRSGALLLAAILFATLLPAHSARAEVRITSTAAEVVRVEAHDASVEEVLSALHEQFGVQYRSPQPLQLRINGIFEGPLQRVVTRLLAGYDFFVKRQAGTITAVIIGDSRGGQFRDAARP